MVKAAAGGGGRGIRLVNSAEEFPDAAARAMQEAQAAFGNPAIYVEKNLQPVRHIEVQIIADKFGNIVPLGERECSIQRRHQKIIEECPSIAVSPELRRSLDARRGPHRPSRELPQRRHGRVPADRRRRATTSSK